MNTSDFAQRLADKLIAQLKEGLQACAVNGSKAPEQLERWLPWNFIHHDAAGVEQPPVSSQARAP